MPHCHRYVCTRTPLSLVLHIFGLIQNVEKAFAHTYIHGPLTSRVAANPLTVNQGSGSGLQLEAENAALY